MYQQSSWLIQGKSRAYFTNFETLVHKYNIERTEIYNMDETGTSSVQKSVQILAPKCEKLEGWVTSSERGRNITVMCCMSASNSCISPMFIYTRSRMSPLLERVGPAGSLCRCSHNG